MPKFWWPRKKQLSSYINQQMKAKILQNSNIIQKQIDTTYGKFTGFIQAKVNASNQYVIKFIHFKLIEVLI